MKAKKKYGKGGKYSMYEKGGVTTKKKKLSPAEREAETTKMANVAKERLAEMEAEKAYLKRRSEADRQYKQAIKEGATPEQATKIAEKYLKNGGKMSMYLKGGQVKPKKNTLAKDVLKEVDVVAELPRKKRGSIEKPNLLDAIRYSAATKTTAKDWESKQHPAMKMSKTEPIMGYPPIEAIPFSMPIKGAKNIPRGLDVLLDLFEYNRDKKYKHGGKMLKPKKK